MIPNGSEGAPAFQPMMAKCLVRIGNNLEGYPPSCHLHHRVSHDDADSPLEHCDPICLGSRCFYAVPVTITHVSYCWVKRLELLLDPERYTSFALAMLLCLDNLNC